MKKDRSPFIVLLVVLQALLGIGAVISGAMLTLSPDGSYLQLPLNLLDNSPFSDYLIPGIVLFVFVGIFPLFVAYGLWKTPAWKNINTLNPFKKFHWVWTTSLASGLILLIWIGTETVLVGYVSFLQPLMGAWGLIIIFLTLLPVVKRHYHVK